MPQQIQTMALYPLTHSVPAGMSPIAWENDSWPLGCSLFASATGEFVFRDYPEWKAPLLPFDDLATLIRSRLGEPSWPAFATLYAQGHASLCAASLTMPCDAFDTLMVVLHARKQAQPLQ